MISIPVTHTEYPSLNFLHLSDIHFLKGKSNGVYDLDEDVRHQLEIDAKKVVNQIGDVNAIIVTGDIAYTGAFEEYILAKSWLEKLQRIVNCVPPIILTVPGNHDVDQSLYAKDAFLQSALGSITSSNSDSEINSALIKIYSSPRSDSILYDPIKHYNVFASEYGCEITHVKQFWSRDFFLENGIKIHFRGLNSVLGSRHGDERMRNLFLGLKQLQIPTESNTLNITLCHHPPDWLKDYDQVEEYLYDRANIQLFGHKHKLRFQPADKNLRIVAGAVHPSRNEDGWVPRYNFIKISPHSRNSVKLQLFPRVWKDTKFSPDYLITGGATYVEKIFELTVDENSTEAYVASIEKYSPTLAISDESEIAIIETSVIVDEENKMSSSGVEYGKILVRRFLNLDEFKRDKIINELKLNVPPFSDLQNTEIFREIFLRAKKRELLKILWEKVEEEHADNMFDINPFEEN